MIRQDILPSVHYVAVFEDSAVLNVRQLAEAYLDVLNREELNALIVDIRYGAPMLEPHDYEQFFKLTGESWAKLGTLVYLYNEQNRMRAAYFTKLVKQLGVDAVAAASWDQISETLPYDIGSDPQKERV